jgi:hypothetical protein
MSGYTIFKSNGTDTVTVPAMPPGINTVDTSLNLVGRGYPNYGEKIAENFLHLLENFASSIPPENPIEGQLWYDTSDIRRKVLRVMDGTSTSARWPSANGIYQQDTDPKLAPSAGLKEGDIWVDTGNNQLKIYKNNAWTTVGPSTTGGTGIESAELTDVGSGAKHTVIKTIVDKKVVSIISTATFTPVEVITGFTTIRSGITLTTGTQLYGTVSNAAELGNFPAASYLRKDDGAGQLITGKVVYVTPTDQDDSEGRDGVVIRVSGDPATEYVQFYKAGNDAVISNNKTGGKVLFKIKDSAGDTVIVDKNVVAINTTTNAGSPSLDVYGTANISSTLTVANVTVTKSVSIANTLTVSGNLVVGNTATIANTLTMSTVVGSGTVIKPATADVYDIGTASLPFRDLYANNVHARNYYIIPGTLQLWPADTVPGGWLKCNGSTATTSSYIELYAVIGNKYGTTATGHFFLPNLYTTSTTAGGPTTTYYIIKT